MTEEQKKCNHEWKEIESMKGGFYYCIHCDILVTQYIDKLEKQNEKLKDALRQYVGRCLWEDRDERPKIYLTYDIAAEALEDK
jgi:hypothetical protein